MNDRKIPDVFVGANPIAPEAAVETTIPAPEAAPAAAEEVLASPSVLPAEEIVAKSVLEAASPDAKEEPSLAPPAPLASIRLQKKHPLAIRWMHWINFPVLATMIWSGLLIYWGDSKIDGSHQSAIYRLGLGKWTIVRFFPEWFWTWFPVSLNFIGRAWHGAAYKITTGLGYHFFFMWFFMLNGGTGRNLPQRHQCGTRQLLSA